MPEQISPTKSALECFPCGLEDTTDGLYNIDISDFPAAPFLYIAAQTEVRKLIGTDPATGELIYQEETAWAEGDEICLGKNWLIYFVFSLN